MISTELKMRIKNAVRKYKRAESVSVMNLAAEEMCDCLEEVLKENMNEMIANLK